MANDIHPGNQRKWTLSYTKDDGTPGAIDITNQDTQISLDPAEFCATIVGPFDPASGKQVITVVHNGNIAAGVITVTNDGDLGGGVVAITAAEQFNMLAPGGATSVSSSVGDEEPAPTVTPLPSSRKK